MVGLQIFVFILINHDQTYVMHLVRWFQPSEHQVALNVDGSSYGNLGRTCYGGLNRDYKGSWIKGLVDLLVLPIV